jgi:hypothetical protein
VPAISDTMMGTMQTFEMEAIQLHLMGDLVIFYDVKSLKILLLL